jgi:hypothetical protein
MGVSGQRHAQAAPLPPGKGPPIPTVQEAGWAPEPVWTQRLEEKLIPLVKWVPFYHGMARSQVSVRGDGLHIWRIAANILNNQSRTANKGWPSSLVVGRG